MLDFKTVEEFPKPTRGSSKRSEERKQIQDQLLTGKGTLIENVKQGNEFNNLQQRIRLAGEAIGIKVTVVFQKHDDGETGDLYFKVSDKKAKVAADV